MYEMNELEYFPSNTVLKYKYIESHFGEKDYDKKELNLPENSINKVGTVLY